MDKTVETRESAVIRFVGDSGDGMQITGAQFTETTALAGNDLATFPDYPSEIRAPAGTLAGVSGFQIQFSSSEVFTPGDAPDALVAMNPAALRVNLPDLRRGGLVIANAGEFSRKSLEKAGYGSHPLEDGSLAAYRAFSVDITGLTLRALEGLDLPKSMAERSKNFFALGLVCWLFHRDIAHTVAWIHKRFSKGDPRVGEANVRALQAGHAYGETAEIFSHSYIVPPARLPPGRYRTVSGNEALSLGLVTAAELAGLELFLASYPITPASDILHQLARHKAMGVRVFQAEDEIAAMAAAIGAAYAGTLSVTTTSGPGLALKGEGLSLAIMLELPLVVVDVQRGGPSTGLPTKTEQADLLQALWGRHGEAPLPVLAASSPADCYFAAIEAARIALRHMTPVLLLSDGYLANGAEPFRIPEVSALPRIPVRFHTEREGFRPYAHDAVNLARPWAIPGTPGLEHRIGGLEKQEGSGSVSYDGDNHERMCRLRAERVARVAEHLDPTEVFGPASGRLLVVGWGGTYGALRAAVRTLQGRGEAVSHVHLRHLNPLPADLGDILRRFDRVVVPELNLGQLALVLRARYLVDAEPLSRLQGKPFKEGELVELLGARLEVSP